MEGKMAAGAFGALGTMGEAVPLTFSWYKLIKCNMWLCCVSLQCWYGPGAHGYGQLLWHRTQEKGRRWDLVHLVSSMCILYLFLLFLLQIILMPPMLMWRYETDVRKEETIFHVALSGKREEIMWTVLLRVRVFTNDRFLSDWLLWGFNILGTCLVARFWYKISLCSSSPAS